ncbi:hypothetical protein [Treponema succinifaciens]|uniref:hypothetical protein n=1 Tax=Treponema succinifaciens TaxID=167 RepID=UPI003F81233D
MHNPDFKRSEFDTFKTDAGTNAFTFSIKEWNENLCGKGIITKSGRNGGGIFAYSDIALEFASWLSLSRNLNRDLTKLNYHIHTGAIKENLILPELTPAQKSFVYADEVDLLNVALFDKTAKEWRTENPKKKEKIRNYATISQLLVLVNLESYNAILIEQGAAIF